MSDKIYKHNPVINGHFIETKDKKVSTKKDVPLPLSEFEWDCLNAIYAITQQSLWAICPSEYTNHTKQEFSYSEIRDTMKYKGNDYIDKIDALVTKLYGADIVLKNYVDPETGKKIRSDNRRILQRYSVYEEGEARLMVEFSNDFIACIMRHSSNFTIIDRQEVRKVKGKYGKPIYERLKSKQSLYPSLFFKLRDLNEMFCVNESTLRRHKERVKRITLQNKDIFKVIEYDDGFEFSLI